MNEWIKQRTGSFWDTNPCHRAETTPQHARTSLVHRPKIKFITRIWSSHLAVDTSIAPSIRLKSLNRITKDCRSKQFHERDYNSWALSFNSLFFSFKLVLLCWCRDSVMLGSIYNWMWLCYPLIRVTSGTCFQPTHKRMTVMKFPKRCKIKDCVWFTYKAILNTMPTLRFIRNIKDLNFD